MKRLGFTISISILLHFTFSHSYAQSHRSWSRINTFINEIAAEEITDVERIRKCLELSATTDGPERSLVNMLTADVLYTYYNIHSEEIYEQEPLPWKEGDVSTWSADSLIARIDRLHSGLLSEAYSISGIPAINLGPLVGKNPRLSPHYASLWDVYLDIALDFYQDPVTQLGPEPPKLLARQVILAPDSLLKLSFPGGFDTHGFYRQIQLFQKTLSMHQHAGNWDAYVFRGIQFLKLLTKESKGRNKISRYSLALSKLMEEVEGKAAVTMVQYELSRLHCLLAVQYDPQFSNDYKDEYLKAKRLCDAAISEFPETIGAKRCQALLSLMNQRFVGAQLENINLPQKPFRMRLTYRNLDQIYIRIFSFEGEAMQKFKELPNDSSRIAWFRQQDPLKNWSVLLPRMEDFHFHSTEIPIDPLPEGRYLFLLADNPDFQTKNHGVAFCHTKVSSVYIHEVVDSLQLKYLALDRETGFPIKHFNFWKKQEKSTKPFTVIEKSADSIFAQIPIASKSLGQYRVLAEYANDSMEIMSSSISDALFSIKGNNQTSALSGWEKIKTRSLLLPERKSVSKGQTIAFQGLLYKDSLGYHNIHPDTTIEVKLMDSDAKAWDHTILTVEKGGSFRGELEIPADLKKTERLYLSAPRKVVPLTIQKDTVPGFSLRIEPINDYYQLGDTVRLRAKLLALRGNRIKNALLAYEIKRTVRFPHWESENWWRKSPLSDTTQYDKGNMLLDEQGNFEIAFRAMPDLGVKSRWNPVYDFWISITAVNEGGETRSFRTNLPIGASNYLLYAQTPGVISKGDSLPVKVFGMPLHGPMFVSPALISVYSLKSPDRIFRERLWRRPEFQVIGDSVYKALFPYDPYAFEHQWEDWELTDTLYQREIDLLNQQELSLPPINRSGYYKLQIKAYDQDGHQVLVNRMFHMVDPEEDSSSFPLPFKASVLTFPKSFGDTAEILLQTSMDSIWIHTAVFHGNVPVKHEFYSLNKYKAKRFSLPLKEEYRSGLGISFFTMVQNQAVKQFLKLPPPRTGLNPSPEVDWKAINVDHRSIQLPLPFDGDHLSALASIQANTHSSWDSSLIRRQFFPRIRYWSLPISRLSLRPSRLNSQDWNPILPLARKGKLNFSWTGKLTPESIDHREAVAYRNLQRMIFKPPAYRELPYLGAKPSAFSSLYRNPMNDGEAKLSLLPQISPISVPKISTETKRKSLTFSLPERAGNYQLHQLLINDPWDLSYSSSPFKIDRSFSAYLPSIPHIGWNDSLSLPLRIVYLKSEARSYSITTTAYPKNLHYSQSFSSFQDSLGWRIFKPQAGKRFLDFSMAFKSVGDSMSIKSSIAVIPEKTYQAKVSNKYMSPKARLTIEDLEGKGSKSLHLHQSPEAMIWKQLIEQSEVDEAYSGIYLRKFLRAILKEVKEGQQKAENMRAIKNYSDAFWIAYAREAEPAYWNFKLMQVLAFAKKHGLGQKIHWNYENRRIKKLLYTTDSLALDLLNSGEEISKGMVFQYLMDKKALGIKQGDPFHLNTKVSACIDSWKQLDQITQIQLALWAMGEGQEELARKVYAAIEGVELRGKKRLLMSKLTYALGITEKPEVVLKMLWLYPMGNLSTEELVLISELMEASSFQNSQKVSRLKVLVKVNNKKYKLNSLRTFLEIPEKVEELNIRNKSKQALWYSLTSEQEASFFERGSLIKTPFLVRGPNNIPIEDGALLRQGDTLLLKVQSRINEIQGDMLSWTDYLPSGAKLLALEKGLVGMKAHPHHLDGLLSADHANGTYSYIIRLEYPGKYSIGNIKLDEQLIAFPQMLRVAKRE